MCLQPLHKAARCDFRMSSEQGASATIEYLVSQGANIMARTKGGETVIPGRGGSVQASSLPAGSCLTWQPTVGSL